MSACELTLYSLIYYYYCQFYHHKYHSHLSYHHLYASSPLFSGEEEIPVTTLVVILFNSYINLFRHPKDSGGSLATH